MDEQNNGRVGEGGGKSPAEELYDKLSDFISGLFRAMTAKERLLALVSFIFTGALAFFAAEKGIPFMPSTAGGGLSRPLGDAILCASGTYTPAAFIALVYAAIRAGEGALPRIVALSALFALRTGVSIRMRDDGGDFTGFYRENAVISVGISALFSLFTVGVRLISIPVSLESLSEVLLMLLLTPALTAALRGGFCYKNAFGAVNHRKLYSFYGELSTYFLFVICVYALNGRHFLGSSLSALSAIFLTVITAVRGGALRGGALGAVLGLVISHEYAPVLTVTGIFAGVLSGLGVGASVGIACIAGCVVALYAYGYKAVWERVPEFIIATAITSPIVRYGFLPEGFPIYGKRVLRRVGRVVCDVDARSASLCSDMLLRVSSGFAALSSPPASVKKSGEDSLIPDVNYVCEQLKRGFCDTCPLVCICWDNGNGAAKAAVKMAISEIYTPEKHSDERFRVKGGFKCIHPSEVRRELIRICESPEGRASALPPPPMGFFEDCLCVSEVLEGIARAGEAENETDTVATAKARRAVSALGIGAEEIAVFGRRRKTAVIYGADMRAVNDSFEKLTYALARACGCEFLPPCLLMGGDEGTAQEESKSLRRGERRLVFKSSDPFSVDFAYAQRRGTRDEPNGDSVVGFASDDGYFYCVLCDGMGSGTEAADCSENAVNTVKKLLECHVSPSLAGKLTGNAVKQGYDECFTTLDLLSVDLTSGRAELLKSGAACSFVLRNGEAKRLSAPSLPLGISYETVPEGIDMLLLDGDIIVMISDGVAEEEIDEQRLAERLAYLSERDPKLLAERVLSAALGDGAVRDDMTVAVIKFLVSNG